MFDDDKQFIPPKGFGRKVTLEDKIRAIKDDDEFVEHWANEIRSIKNMSTANILRSMVFEVMTAESSCPIYFGDDYEIYTESVEQGLNEPCFSILCLNPTNEQFLGRRYFRKNQFCIHYFPKGEEKNKEIMSI